ncbi:MAG: T9SS type A sorting domain-containing protein [Bacteroidetes bacterium]|nr:T9SS type A sorting domain-containing protein [Bacteroidota bacterium]MBX7239503.1 T9SS type A sorting domain-containing protein [Bacteroidia bacterium]MBS1923301.1 T9SS type A sorting domain-containing protein [Bacteroidota bacterium]MCW5919838.1 T9SS type A sorting domain-containing protein [Bacteroidota bacterium]HCI57638.1 hypothetical protein [Bacteroidota bacterium]
MKKVVLNLICAMLFSNFKSFSQNCELLCNGDFENPLVISTPHFVNNNAMRCWQTTATDSLMELWESGYNGVTAYSGNQFMEINANQVAAVYQDVSLIAGDSLTISFAHRARFGIDTMSVSLGTQNNLPTVLGYFADSTSSWGHYVINYTIPVSGYYRISFNSVYSGGNLASLGNFIDAVSVCGSSVGFDDYKQTGTFFIYPNLSTKGVTIKLNDDGKGVLTICDILGKTLYSATLNLTENQIETGPLERGVYVVSLLKNNKIVSKRFLVN